MKKTEFTESEELVTGARVKISNQVPIELSAAVCFGCVLGWGVFYLIIQFIL